MHAQLYQIALLGSDRARADAGLLGELARLGIDTNGDPEEVLLQGLAFYRQLEKVGRPFGILTALPAMAPDSEDKMCHPRAARFLRQILNGLFPDALIEFLQELREAGQVLPPESLPDLFERACQEAFLTPQILPVMGIRGAWLQAQHPEWRHIGLEDAVFEPLLTEEAETIRKKFKGFSKTSQKELTLWLERVDPELWPVWLDCDRAQVLIQLLPSLAPADWRFLIRAALSYNRRDWLESMARFFLESGGTHSGMWDHHEGHLLIRALSGPVFNKMAREYLSRQLRPLLFRQFLTSLFIHSLQPWDDRLALSFLDHFAGNIEDMAVWEGMHYSHLLRSLAYRCDPAFLPTLMSFSWPSDSSYWVRWSKEVEQLFRILHFRKEMLEAFKSKDMTD